ncbi:heat shock protein HtpX [Halogranum amylolyticum]|uniref:Heat shock protein HtpX n=1 Tax=Halogranum amylolyticum TaxID=660520 RepID=A0A1H8W2C9_9EURY|nr:M48 family metalloprotease [Halogranum amylolyticum]SEP21637.1 heat shock protein HtpX [Halogranum amylolyticum]
MSLRPDYRLRVRLAGAVLVVLGFDAALVLLPSWLASLAFESVTVSDALLATAVGTPFIVLLQAAYAYHRTLGSVSPRVVTATEHPDLHTLLDRLCQQANAPKPRLAVADSPVPNSVVAGRPGEPAIVFTTALVDALDDEELAAVLAHELAHVVNRDRLAVVFAAAPAIVAHRYLVWQSERLSRDVDRTDERGFVGLGENNFLSALVGIAVGLVFGVVSEAVFRLFAVQREYGADRAAARLTGNPAALASALATLDDRARAIPSRDLRAHDSSVKAVSFLPYPFEHRERETVDSNADIDWTDPAAVEAMYEEQPLRRRNESTEAGEEPIPFPVRSHPRTRRRIERLRATT